MCGRFTLTIGSTRLQAAFPGLLLPEDGPPLAPRYNIVPTQPVATILNGETPCLRHLRWGLIPFWVRDVETGARLINARAETIAEKPSFHTAFRRRRCLIPADGFYEWQRLSSGRRQPVYVRLQSHGVFAFAGLWERWSPPEGGETNALYSCAIITTAPNELLESIHNRMPVILPPSAYQAWLAPGDVSAAALQSLLRPYPAAEMNAYPVACTVNNPRNDSPDCVRSVERR
ncbi:MAG: SOS response-associated peptidase [Anaerolineales bacterium]|nr:SOS response-associated peptidase [Anaerolineales bacterium]HJO33888.1 SOS response-associated peptidase [Anaerolineales bacterium]|tara:strand:+ start:515 stop:1207 length:693 start_codon:yes stop_codon:yes gene_type:complete